MDSLSLSIQGLKAILVGMAPSAILSSFIIIAGKTYIDGNLESKGTIEILLEEVEKEKEKLKDKKSENINLNKEKNAIIRRKEENKNSICSLKEEISTLEHERNFIIKMIIEDNIELLDKKFNEGLNSEEIVEELPEDSKTPLQKNLTVETITWRSI